MKQSAPADWLMPRTTRLPIHKKKKKQTIHNKISSAIYWAERNDARLIPHPSRYQHPEEYKAWVKAKGYYAVIFSHSWAKKFWGDAKYCTCRNIEHKGKCWEYHLQQQLLYREGGRQAPLKYIEKFGY